MMPKAWKTTLILLLCARSARAETTLSFAAEVSDENLAEDAILLVHCLAEHGGHPWEFTGEARGPLWVRVKEEGRALRGTYHKDGKDHAFSLRAGEADEACEKLEPTASTAAPLAPHRGPTVADNVPAGLGDLQGEEPEAPHRKAWIWATVGLAALGSFLLWRAHQPSYRTVEMR